MHYARLLRRGTTELVSRRHWCEVEDCDKPVIGNGLCSAHYYRLKRHGSTDDPTPSDGERFWEKVDRSGGPDACWPWLAKRNWMGYGNFWADGREWMAHRWAYQELVGPITEGLTLDHLCRNRWCVNPAHMEQVTLGENILRGEGPAAKNRRKTHCKRGHPFDEANTYRFGPQKQWRMCRTCAGLRQAQP